MLKIKQEKRKRTLPSDSSDSSAEIPYCENDNSVKNEEDEQEEREPVKKRVGEYVMFKYKGELVPEKITCMNECTATISSMEKCGGLGKWPDRPDVPEYRWDSVVSPINQPRKSSRTGNAVPALDFILTQELLCNL